MLVCLFVVVDPYDNGDVRLFLLFVVHTLLQDDVGVRDRFLLE